MHVLCSVGTRGRYDSTLPMTLVAIHNQIRPPDTLLLIDDTPPAHRITDLYKHSFIGPILMALSTRMEVHIIFGPGRGPQHNHEFARTSTYAKELIWRVDDDECPEPCVLDMLLTAMQRNPRLGAVAGLVIVPGGVRSNKHASAALEDLPTAKNVQWYTWPVGHKFPKVDHLHSSYLYKKEAAAYPIGLSSVGHTEETQHTLRIKQAGYDLDIIPEAITWHYRSPQGGIRAQNGDYTKDDETFHTYLDTLSIPFTKRFPIVMGQGLGDCFALLSVLPTIQERAEKQGFNCLLFAKQSLFDFIKKRAPEQMDVFPEGEFQLWNFTGVFSVYDWWTKYNAANPGTPFAGNLADAYLAMYTERLSKGVFQ